MGEAYMGNQHRFRILDSVLETTYNPNHALSAHMGYVLASQFSKYLLLEGGSMNGLLTTLNIIPRNTSLFDIGAESRGIRWECRICNKIKKSERNKNYWFCNW